MGIAANATVRAVGIENLVATAAHMPRLAVYVGTSATSGSLLRMIHCKTFITRVVVSSAPPLGLAALALPKASQASGPLHQRAAGGWGWLKAKETRGEETRHECLLRLTLTP
jgi:hypothetical protein